MKNYPLRQLRESEERLARRYAGLKTGDAPFPAASDVEKQRDRWRSLVPEGLAREQAADERRRAIKRAVAAGATDAEIAAHLGVSSARIAQMRRAHIPHRRTPLERYFAEQGTLMEIVSFAHRRSKQYRVSIPVTRRRLATLPFPTFHY